MTTAITKESLSARIAELESGARSLKEDYTLAAYKMLLATMEADNSPIIPEGYRLQPISEYESMCATINSDEWPQRWIPVSEQMPEIRKYCLDVTVIIAVRGEKSGSEALYCSDGNFRWGRDEPPIEDVTHWMPLPAAPAK